MKKKSFGEQLESVLVGDINTLLTEDAYPREKLRLKKLRANCDHDWRSDNDKAKCTKCHKISTFKRINSAITAAAVAKTLRLKRAGELAENASPVVKDYLKHVANGVKASNTQSAKDHFRKAVETKKIMTAAGRREAEKFLPDDHKEWLKRSNDNFDLSPVD